MEACLGVRHTNSMQFVMVEKLQKSPKSRNCRNHQSRETAQIVCNALTSAHALRCAKVEKGRSLTRGVLALKIYLGLMGVKDVHETWSQKDPLKAYRELLKVMSFRLFSGLKKHFRVSITDDLPDRDGEDYHPLCCKLFARKSSRKLDSRKSTCFG